MVKELWSGLPTASGACPKLSSRTRLQAAVREGVHPLRSGSFSDSARLLPALQGWLKGVNSNTLLP